MLTIVLLVGSILGLLIARKNGWVQLVCGMALFIVFLLIICPEENINTEYDDWRFVEQKELVSLSNTVEGRKKYAIISAENVYTYRFKSQSGFGTDTSNEYEVDVVSGNVVEVEDPECKQPLLTRYKSKIQVGKWNVILPGFREMYVFYVPEGTIQKEISLK